MVSYVCNIQKYRKYTCIISATESLTNLMQLLLRNRMCTQEMMMYSIAKIKALIDINGISTNLELF